MLEEPHPGGTPSWRKPYPKANPILEETPQLVALVAFGHLWIQRDRTQQPRMSPPCSQHRQPRVRCVEPTSPPAPHLPAAPKPGTRQPWAGSC